MSVRAVLWSHAVVVCYLGAVVHLERWRVLSLVAGDEYGGYSAARRLLWQSLNWVSLTIYLFPLLVVIAVFRTSKPQTIFIGIAAELLLIAGHIAALLPVVTC